MQRTTGDDQPVEIYHGVRGEEFKRFIYNLLSYGNIKQKYMDLLTNDESMELFSAMFTASSADSVNNYEIYETLGDINANKIIIWYAFRKFPQINCAAGVRILANIKSKYGSKNTFAQIGDKLGFFEFISASVEDRHRKRKSLIEDCFEAFCCAVEILIDSYTTRGVGFAILYDIVEGIFEKHMPISIRYEDLTDAVTRLKELFDKAPGVRPPLTIDYEYDEDRSGEHRMFIAKVVYGAREVVGHGKAALKATAKEEAARQALETFASRGYKLPIPEAYIKLCM
jgi:dsRNA-specific ribonuclease